MQNLAILKMRGAGEERTPAQSRFFIAACPSVSLPEESLPLSDDGRQSFSGGDDMEFWTNFKSFRKEFKISLRNAAVFIRKNATSILYYETGKVMPSHETMLRARKLMLIMLCRTRHNGMIRRVS
jgi:hypothetical protein